MSENAEIIDFIKKTPKIELHLHIEGTLEPEHMFELAKRNNISIPYKNIEEVKSAYNFQNLDSFLNVYYQGSKVLISEQDFFDLTWAYILKCKKDNIVHTEIFFDPQAHVDRGIDFDIVINGIYKALKKANKELNLTSKIIMCFLRHLDEESGFKILNQALKHKDKIIGVGLDSSELENPPKKFEKLFRKAIEEGFLTVAHAGEEGPPEFIWDSINLLKVKRIDHGIQCLRDEKLVEELIKTQIPLTVCPLSNVKLCVFDRLENHNLKKMLNRGLRVMVNSDDPAYFGGYLNKNLIETQSALNLSIEEVKTLIINSFKSSFLDDVQKNEWIAKIN
ncbi:MAG: adenosine deaminase [Candidatus Pelagibacter sp.]|jgi:adenosine deaminase|nr:adenosine deaminase [Candidatus Pelagibacter sp.]MDP7541343.1 adenosine deaminase [Candidatus Pelagibacter bacterium]